MLLLEWENNEPSEYEACYRSSILNDLTKTVLNLVFLFLATNPTVFSLANLSTNIPSTTISSTTLISTAFYIPFDSTSD